MKMTSDLWSHSWMLRYAFYKESIKTFIEVDMQVNSNLKALCTNVQSIGHKIYKKIIKYGFSYLVVKWRRSHRCLCYVTLLMKLKQAVTPVCGHSLDCNFIDFFSSIQHFSHWDFVDVHTTTQTYSELLTKTYMMVRTVVLEWDFERGFGHCGSHSLWGLF